MRWIVGDSDREGDEHRHTEPAAVEDGRRMQESGLYNKLEEV